MDSTLIKIGRAVGPNPIGSAQVASEGEDTMVSKENLVYQGGVVYKGISAKITVGLLSLKPKAIVKKQKTTVLSSTNKKTLDWKVSSSPSFSKSDLQYFNF